ncbi:MAG: Nif3-like dinuclear metal center hexameric protein [Myxococcales bacterium]|nr:Nif3-like dinuclear metal center hexameric protein [Myxococcales bacterium]
MSTIRALESAMEQIAPTRFAAEWDNVGLLVGDRDAKLERALLTIDLWPEVYEEARALGADAVIAYHPPIFKPVARVLPGSIAFDAVRDKIAIYSPHTALDAATGGTNDVLADAVGISPTDRRGLDPPAPKDRAFKLVTFVPEDSVDKVADALFAAGAGRIGDYSRCSFRLRGTGTFFGDPASTSPVVGESGRLETVDEARLEVLVPIAKLDAVLAAHRRAHPYETPAFDLVRIATPPEHMGFGRVGPLETPAPLTDVLARLKHALSVDHLLVAGPTDRLVRTAAVGAGATGELLGAALKANVDLFVLGEMRHHDALRAATQSTTVVMTLHSNSERATLKTLRDRLATLLPSVSLHVSARDRDPFTVR